jgi:hypothetical protein
MERDSLGRTQRTYHERVNADDVRATLGDRGVTFGELYAYAWDHNAERYNVVKLYAHAVNRVTRHMVAENPDGPRRLGRARVNAHHSRRQRDRAMRTDTLWNVSTGILADVARAARKRAYVAQGIGV